MLRRFLERDVDNQRICTCVSASVDFGSIARASLPPWRVVLLESHGGFFLPLDSLQETFAPTALCIHLFESLSSVYISVNTQGNVEI